MSDLARSLLDGTDPPEGLLLPVDAVGLSIWVQSAGINSAANLWARLRDAEGRYFDTWVGNLGAQGWTKIDTDLSPVVASARRPTTRTNREPFPT